MTNREPHGVPYQALFERFPRPISVFRLSRRGGAALDLVARNPAAAREHGAAHGAAPPAGSTGSGDEGAAAWLEHARAALACGEVRPLASGPAADQDALVAVPFGQDLVAVVGGAPGARDGAERRRLEEQTRQVQRLETVGRVAGGVAHDFNNLLTVILACAEELRRELVDASPEALEDLEEIRAAGERGKDLVSQLLAFARRQPISPVSLDLNSTVRGMERLLGRVLGEDVLLELRLQPGLWQVRCDPGQFEQVVLNLAVNARDAMPGGGRLGLETANVEASGLDPSLDLSRPGPHVRFTVRDTGGGMSPEVLARVFEPFFTTKAPGRGTGLGLATVYGVVKQSEGAVHVESELGRGTRFDLYFPRSDAAPEERPATAAREPRGGDETVLVAEDDENVRETMRRTLRAAGYQVLAAAGGREALALAGRAAGRIDLLVADVVMPDLKGPEVAAELRRARPGLRVLYVSGYTEDALAERGLALAGELLRKPFHPSGLLARVRAELDEG